MSSIKIYLSFAHQPLRSGTTPNIIWYPNMPCLLIFKLLSFLLNLFIFDLATISTPDHPIDDTLEYINELMQRIEGHKESAAKYSKYQEIFKVFPPTHERMAFVTYIYLADYSFSI